MNLARRFSADEKKHTWLSVNVYISSNEDDIQVVTWTIAALLNEVKKYI